MTIARVWSGPLSVDHPCRRGRYPLDDPAWAAIRCSASPQPSHDRPVAPAGLPGRTSRARPRRNLGQAAFDQPDRLDHDGPAAASSAPGRSPRGSAAARQDGRSPRGPRARPDPRRPDARAPHGPETHRPAAGRTRTVLRPVECRLAGFQDLACHDVGVDDHDSRPLPEPPRHGGLPAADRPRDADPERPARPGDGSRVMTGV